jgi:hypothetical protein
VTAGAASKTPPWEVGVRIALASLLSAFSLAGCGGSSHAPASNASAASGSSSTGSSSGIAAPGTTLRFGQTATLSYQSDAGGNTPTYRVTVTVQAPERGTLADFNGIQLDSTEKAGTPDYVRARLTNLGPGSIDTADDDPSIELDGVDGTGNLQDSVSFIGTFPRCPQATAPNPWPSGKSLTTCLTFLVPGGISKVGWVGTSGYLNTPVMWAAG